MSDEELERLHSEFKRLYEEKVLRHGKGH
jgi:hypothetical protein